MCYAYAQESIPTTHHDIATPEIARQWEHLITTADKIPFKKFSTVARGERPDRKEVYEVVVCFECAEVLFVLWLSCYEI